jgi:hypothetical protein
MDDAFIAKAAIKGVLDKCPSIWPLDLDKQCDKGEVSITKAMEDEWDHLNKGLLIPIDGGDIAEIIKLAKEFLAETGVTN